MLPPIASFSHWNATSSADRSTERVVNGERRSVLDQALSLFPSDLIGLVAEYDSTLAMRPLQLGLDSAVLLSDENDAIWTAVREALIAPDTDPRITRQIIVNVLQYRYEQKFNKLLSEFESNQVRIKLDQVDLSCMRLKEIHFPLASAVNIDLTDSVLENVGLSGAMLAGANLTDTTFRNVFLANADLTGAQFTRTCFVGCYATNLITTEFRLNRLTYLAGSELYLNGMHTSHQSSHQSRRRRLMPPAPNFAPPCVIA